MSLIDIKIKLLRKNAEIPQRSTLGSAGYDLKACIEEKIIIKPGESIKIPTGIAIRFTNNNYGGFVFSRSGLATKHGINLSNSVGVIDSDYTGEIIVSLNNISKIDYCVSPNDRIAQLVVLPVYSLNFISEENSIDFEETERGSGGFGSTGK